MGSSVDSDDGANIFTIMVSTDNHLGFAEKDHERGGDSFNTFEEMLELAVQHNVDFILLGGDLFHDNKPSRQAQIKCIDLLRKYTFGDKPVMFDFVSDPVENFPHLKNPNVNYQDPNLNVAIPVFSIHGNHDDPAGLGQFCALDTLSTAGLVNFFGRVTDLKEIKVSPLLLVKGEAKIALFGLSSVKDERLFRLFREEKVKMLRPRESLDKWFNLMVLHQNHSKHSSTNYLPEEFLDEFLDLIIWGHEHECLINPTINATKSFFVSQPGSSVATSLCAGESKKKQVAILEVAKDKKMRMNPLPLNTVRPFVFEDICLADHDIEPPLPNQPDNPVEVFITNHIHGMIKQSRKLLTGHPRQPKKPLIRLRVEYSDSSEMFNVSRFGHKFASEVANPDDILLFKKQREGKKNEDASAIDQELMDAVYDAKTNEVKVEDLVETYFSELTDEADKQLQLLTERGLARAVTNYVEKDDKDSIYGIVQHQIDKMAAHLSNLSDLEDDDIEAAIIEYKQARLNKKNHEDEDKEIDQAISNTSRGRVNEDVNSASDDDDDDDDDSTATDTSNRGKGRGSNSTRSRGSRGSRGRSTTSSLKSTSKDVSSNGRGRGRGRGSRGTTIQSTIMDSFSRGAMQKTSTPGLAKGAMFDSSDSD